MKNTYMLVLLICFTSFIVKAQEPAWPSPCLNNGNANQNNMTISGNTTFTFPTIASFTSSETFNNITVTVKSSARYKLYIAGIITSLIGSSTNTIIPINTFTISATNRGTTSPATITLSNSYFEVAQGAGTNGRSHVLAITRDALNAFTQAPGGHVLTLHIRFCQY